MSIEFQKCLERKKLKRFKATKGVIKKEVHSAKDDLVFARRSFNDKNFKWATIQAYYSMFHSVRALLYSKGYREESHYCLRVAIENLFVKHGLLDSELLDSFDLARGLREDADYRAKFSKGSAQESINSAERFIEGVRKILREIEG
ncbi:MAG: HEPN domain-containing protein [bacterium]|nr:HEPN domain-containing protein [bacterium]